MSERRRSLFVLLLVVGLIAGSVYAISTPTRSSAWTSRAASSSSTRPSRRPSSRPSRRRRSTGRSTSCATASTRSASPSPSSCSRARTRSRSTSRAWRTPSARPQQVGSTAQLFFYDWEANILDEDCQTDPDENASAKQPVTGFYNAVKHASQVRPAGRRQQQRPPTRRASTRSTRPPSSRSTTASRSESREAALEDLDAGAARERRGHRGAGGHPRRARREAEPRRRRIPTAAGSSRTTRRCRARTSRTRSRTSTTRDEPIVTFNFTDKGREAFQGITRHIAERGARQRAPRRHPINGSQHFAIVLDNELVSAPYINCQENPDGIDGSTGAQISGSFTIQSAQDLAKILKIGALPIRLELVSRSQVSATLGQQALDQGLIAGIAGFVDRRALPDHLLPRARRHRRRSRWRSTRSTSTRSSS